MRSLILRVIARVLLPVTVLFAIYLLLRGHNEPGGGFIAGLVTASTIVLQALAFGADWTRQALGRLITPAFAVGLVLAIAAGLIPILGGMPFLTVLHWNMPLPGDGYLHLTTALLFDIGVYMVVVGAAATAISMFAEGER